jgi:adenosylcobyric acid synthase
VTRAYAALSEKYDVIVIEGAGSPAEINLQERDIVNMGMAAYADSPVLLVGDIDRGGVFASIVGTLHLLKEEDRHRVKGIVINKFRGDLKMFEPGVTMLEEIISLPVLGVVPYMDIHLEDEDSVTERLSCGNNGSRPIDIAVIRLPCISNFTDFDVFSLFDDAGLRFIQRVEDLGQPDILIIPGSKNTIADLEFLKSQGFDRELARYHASGGCLIGICGGFQMMGEKILDPHGVEGDTSEMSGFGIFSIKTELEREKVTRQVTGTVAAGEAFLEGLKGVEIEGYEIHMGRVVGGGEQQAFAVTDQGNDGMVLGSAIGTYIHGIFDNTAFTRGLLNNIRKKKGLKPLESSMSYSEFRERQLDKLSDILRESLDMNYIYHVLNEKTKG